MNRAVFNNGCRRNATSRNLVVGEADERESYKDECKDNEGLINDGGGLDCQVDENSIDGTDDIDGENEDEFGDHDYLLGYFDNKADKLSAGVDGGNKKDIHDDDSSPVENEVYNDDHDGIGSNQMDESDAADLIESAAQIGGDDSEGVMLKRVY